MGWGSTPLLSAKELGLKVFMDAHGTVTAEEGDRYPLGPPKIMMRVREVVSQQSHKLQVPGSTPGLRNQCFIRLAQKQSIRLIIERQRSVTSTGYQFYVPVVYIWY